MIGTRTRPFSSSWSSLLVSAALLSSIGRLPAILVHYRCQATTMFPKCKKSIHVLVRKTHSSFESARHLLIFFFCQLAHCCGFA